MTNVVNTVAFLRTSRDFPKDVQQLSDELGKSYIDIANAVNSRIIGIFTVNKPSITGEAWYFTTQKQQTLRQVYTFTTTADINLGFKIRSISEFSRAWGVYTNANGSTWYGIIYATSVAIPGQITFYIDTNAGSTTSDVIKFVVGAGAPALSKGKVIIEWLSQV